MSPAPSHPVVPLGAVAFAWLAAGCGEAPSPVPARDGAVSIEQRDYRFEPEAIRAPAGRLELRVVNRGRLPHALRLRLEGREKVSVPTLLPGERDSVAARLEPGSYRMFCPIGNHEELGMYGVLIVG